jgi:hypothetical protein
VYALAILLMETGLFVIGVRRRLRLERPVYRLFATKLVYLSLAGASVLVLGAFPVLHVLVWAWLRGGAIEANLPPGYGLDALLNVLVVGTAASIVHAFYSYFEHVNSP